MSHPGSPGRFPPDIHVCRLDLLHERVGMIGARHVVSLLPGDATDLMRPPSIAPEDHLWLKLHDISEPLDGHVLPQREHVEQLIDFVKRWPREAPLVIHCWAGISRSSAAAYVAVCALNPAGDERAIADALREASPTATPNALIVRLADDLLARQGRMVNAVKKIGLGRPISQDRPALPFRLGVSGY